MRIIHLRSHGWRFYRNWLIMVGTLAAVVLVAMVTWQANWPWHVYLLGSIPVYLLASTVLTAYRLTHPPINPQYHGTTPADVDLPFETVEFPGRDRLRLSGWYVPGSKRSAVVLVHGFGSRAIHMIYHATAVAIHGHGVLLFDLRAHGNSEGDTCTKGWREPQDLLGAVDYMQSRGDVDPDKIAVLGLSLGANTALQAAALADSIRAVIAEGPGPLVLADHGRPDNLLRLLFFPFNWLSYALLSLMNGTRPPAGILATIGQIAPRPILLISTGRGQERRWTQRCYQAAAEPKELWEITKARHGGGYFARPDEYTARLGAFLAAALENE